MGAERVGDPVPAGNVSDFTPGDDPREFAIGQFWIQLKRLLQLGLGSLVPAKGGEDDGGVEVQVGGASALPDEGLQQACGLTVIAEQVLDPRERVDDGWFAGRESDLYALERIEVEERVEDLVFALEVERFAFQPVGP